MDWAGFEAVWHDSGCHALAEVAEVAEVAELAASRPGEQLYAAAFHLFYADGTVILPPALAANTESAVRVDDGYSTRFSPPEWRWDVLDAAVETMRPWYRQLTPATSVLEAHDAAMARVCKAMTRTARLGGIHPSLPATFVVVILEGQRGDEEADLIRASVDPAILPTVPGLAEHLRAVDQAHP